jgi:GT2 family glycosyltransferase
MEDNPFADVLTAIADHRTHEAARRQSLATRMGLHRSLTDGRRPTCSAAPFGIDRLYLAPDGTPVPCAWRLPSGETALAGALFLHRRFTVESGDSGTHPVGWVQSSAMLVRREAAEQVDWLDPQFFVYSDETDFCKRLSDAGWRILYVPAARAVHHDQLSTDPTAMRRRIVEFQRGRDRYLRKHCSPATRYLWRPLWAWSGARSRYR